MESGRLTNKLDQQMEVEIPSEAEMMVAGSGGPVSGSGPGLTRQPSVTKNNCLCSPTKHAGSFRCRLHRSPSLQRTKSIDTSKPNNNNTTTTTAQ